VTRVQTPSPRGVANSSSPFPVDTARDLSRSLGMELESDPKGKGKEKTPKATPKGTPKIGDTLNSVWGANPVTNPPSPIPPSPLSLVLDAPKTPKTPQVASVAHTPKGKDKKKPLDASSSKHSPSVLTNRSPLGKVEVIAEQPVLPSMEPPPDLPRELPAETLGELPVDQPAPSVETPAPPADQLVPLVEAPAPPAELSAEPPAALSADQAAPSVEAPAPLAEPPAAADQLAPSVEGPAPPAEPPAAADHLAPSVEVPAPSGDPAAAPIDQVTAPPAETPVPPTDQHAEQPVPSPEGLLSSQIASPTTNKKKKKGAKGTSKTASSSNLPSVVATPNVVSAVALVDIGSAPATEDTPNTVPDTKDTTVSDAPPAPLSNVLSPLGLPDSNVVTADTNLTSEGFASLLSPPKESSLFGSSSLNDTAGTGNNETSALFGWGSVTKTPKTPKTPKVGASPWGKSPAKGGGILFSGIGSGSASPKPSTSPAKSPWGTWGSPKPPSSDANPTESLGLNGWGSPSKQDDSPKPAVQEHADNTAPTTSGPTDTESGDVLGVDPKLLDTELSVADETKNPVSSAKPGPQASPKLSLKTADGSLPLDAAEETRAADPESTTELRAAGHLDPASKNPSPKPTASAMEEATKPGGESTDEIKPDNATATEATAETNSKTPADISESQTPNVTEPQTPDITSPTAEDGDGAADEGGGEEGGEVKTEKKGKNPNAGKKKGKKKK
jgi:hypothetical protein